MPTANEKLPDIMYYFNLAAVAKTGIDTYMKSARTEFITGVRDINDHKGWAAHCNTSIP